jgi:paraquat-inducible protein A
LQTLPALAHGMAAQCARCLTTVYRTKVHLRDQSMALTLTALVLLTIMVTTTLMTVQTAGIQHEAALLSGPVELVRRNMVPLAAVVLFVTLLAPLARLIFTLYVLVRMHEAMPPAHLRRVFVLSEQLRPWSMVEVFVFGVFVAYVKLGDLVQIGIGAGVYALLALTLILVWVDGRLDREAVWRRLDKRNAARSTGHVRSWSGGEADAIGCEICGLVSVPQSDHEHCPRCDAALHARKPNSISRTWALVVAAAILYIPANYYPVLTVVQLGAGAPATIIGGVRELVSSGDYPLAALVFFASVAVPMLKLLGLSVMLVTTQTGRSGWLRDRTRLYHVVRWVGRWSMIDIFMESLLGALVKFGSIVTIEPGVGAVAFCGVVILTMFAAETFDPRLMWDSASARAVPHGAG